MIVNDLIWIAAYFKAYSGLIPLIIVYFATTGYVLFDLIKSSIDRDKKDN